ncbi:Pick C1-like protein 1 [Seminavis robusta]|uniref:Pick C1-like protein 1 n=1 Tax=Seminavis robusta TaxID=568900 RepID=A0A9N8H4N9_9STRA|nr:Pick C1-like protein 1 [Seminavis robusta]|eukprot:Sro119_g058270.1 Pick C1-like protein 1 (1422) ;mRNA; r:107044-111654
MANVSQETEKLVLSSRASHASARKVVCKKWSSITDVVHQAISWFVITVSLISARNPKQTIGITTVAAFTLIATGFFTNFNLQVDYEVVYAPFGSQPISHKDWIDNESGFPESPRPMTFVIHNQGENVLGREQVDLLFEALDTVRDTPGYHEICQASNYKNTNGEPDCKLFGATRFWGHSHERFQQEIHSDEEAIQALSAATYPGGTPAYTEFLFGYSKREGLLVDEGGNHNGARLESAKSFYLRIDIPDADGADEFEIEVLDRLMALQQKWENDPDIPLHLSYFTLLSYELEFERAINKDLILVPLVVIIMSTFTCLVFYKGDRVQSRSLLGLCSVAAVGLSLMCGYGLMFLCGVPFTSMSQILPFVVFGVGLDDTFIITGAYFRTNPQKDTVLRIEETMRAVGGSISLTTITTMSAFMLGCMSSIPAIRWVCIYAFPTMFIVFIYQITFFIGCLVLDEKRVKANRTDICFSFVVIEENSEADPEDCQDNDGSRPNQASEGCGDVEAKGLGLAERFMHWYSGKLMQPRVKALVLGTFLAYFGFCAYRTTLLSQRFRNQDFVPKDSYVSDFLDALDTYSEQVMGINVYFTGVNQSDPDVQWEMIEYMQDLIAMPAVNRTPSPFCWIIDFEARKNTPEFQLINDMSFSDQVSLALNHPVIKEAYGDDIVQDENGTIIASRCWLNPKYLDLDSVSQQIDLLNDQRAVSSAQPANKGSLDNMKFFTYSNLYFIWELYSVAVNELVFTTISGIVAVSVIGFFLIEHWSATAFVLPMILMLYVDLLGTLQLAGLYINVVTYVCMVISIGLLVDFLMHIVLKFYESDGASREAKVKETLHTMGASILVGGLSTSLGVLPLAFSTSAILRTVFTAFFAMVALGLTHGLIFLPVVLSMWGPTVCIVPHTADNASANSEAVHVEFDADIEKNFDDMDLKKKKADLASCAESITSDIVSISENSESAEIEMADSETCTALASDNTNPHYSDESKVDASSESNGDENNACATLSDAENDNSHGEELGETQATLSSIPTKSNEADPATSELETNMSEAPVIESTNSSEETNMDLATPVPERIDVDANSLTVHDSKISSFEGTVDLESPAAQPDSSDTTLHPQTMAEEDKLSGTPSTTENTTSSTAPHSQSAVTGSKDEEDIMNDTSSAPEDNSDISPPSQSAATSSKREEKTNDTSLAEDSSSAPPPSHSISSSSNNEENKMNDNCLAADNSSIVPSSQNTMASNKDEAYKINETSSMSLAHKDSTDTTATITDPSNEENQTNCAESVAGSNTGNATAPPNNTTATTNKDQDQMTSTAALADSNTGDATSPLHATTTSTNNDEAQMNNTESGADSNTSDTTSHDQTRDNNEDKLDLAPNMTESSTLDMTSPTQPGSNTGEDQHEMALTLSPPNDTNIASKDSVSSNNSTDDNME